MEEQNISQNESVKEKEPIKSVVYDWLEVIAFSIAIVLLVFTFVGRLTTVDGDSMYPTLKHGEQLIISNLFYEPQNGDIVVVQEQNGYFKGPIVKRIIAKGGQTIRFDFENWKVWVDGELLEEDYINYQPWFPMQSDGCPEELVVPEGYLFVMGDNRNGSTDSRNMSIVGFVSEDEVMGRVIFRLTGRFGKVS
jgi:signal peptidase I